MLALLRKQSSPKKLKRSWFSTVGDQEVFAPRYANVNIVQRMTRGRKNAFPLYKTRKTTLRLFTKDVQDGKLDPIMLEIAEERSKQLTGKRRKKKSRPVRRTRAARKSRKPRAEAPTATA